MDSPVTPLKDPVQKDIWILDTVLKLVPTTKGESLMKSKEHYSNLVHLILFIAKFNTFYT